MNVSLLNQAREAQPGMSPHGWVTMSAEARDALVELAGAADDFLSVTIINDESPRTMRFVAALERLRA